VAVTAIILVRHSAEGFSFESANFVVGPFFRNHVTSAALMATFIPFIVLLWWSTKNVLLKSFYIISIALLLLGVYFSYTRAAHISIVLAIMVYPILRWRLMKLVVAVALLGATIFVMDVIQDNNYLKYAPDFETTISHKTFEDLVDATYQGKDISTMERVYRWVAGFRMVGEKPWTGFGPGNFYNYYKSYTLTLFETYVSDNPERSGIHCYYLMILTEQGFIGLAIFLLLVIAVLLQFESLYHRLEDVWDRWLVVTLTAVFVIILLFQIINDLIETDKMGPFFFLCMALALVLDMKARKRKVVHFSEE
jgi:O-antigen ligase